MYRQIDEGSAKVFHWFVIRQVWCDSPCTPDKYKETWEVQISPYPVPKAFALPNIKDITTLCPRLGIIDTKFRRGPRVSKDDNIGAVYTTTNASDVVFPDA